jgi:hypothetical protein
VRILILPASSNLSFVKHVTRARVFRRPYSLSSRTNPACTRDEAKANDLEKFCSNDKKTYLCTIFSKTTNFETLVGLKTSKEKEDGLKKFLSKKGLMRRQGDFFVGSVLRNRSFSKHDVNKIEVRHSILNKKLPCSSL